MIVNVYVVIDPKGDRPYVSTTEPAHLKSDNVEIFHYMLHVPDKHKMANDPSIVMPESKKD